MGNAEVLEATVAVSQLAQRAILDAFVEQFANAEYHGLWRILVFLSVCGGIAAGLALASV